MSKTQCDFPRFRGDRPRKSTTSNARIQPSTLYRLSTPSLLRFTLQIHPLNTKRSDRYTNGFHSNGHFYLHTLIHNAAHKQMN